MKLVTVVTTLPFGCAGHCIASQMFLVVRIVCALQHTASVSPVALTCACCVVPVLQFSREIASKVSQETQAAIRTAWAATGRMSVSCGPAGRKGLSGIFTLSPSGRPVIWVPKNHGAATRLRALVLAGAGSAEVPAGFEAIEPKVFEDKAGKAKTHNWQLSIVLTGRVLDWC